MFKAVAGLEESQLRALLGQLMRKTTTNQSSRLDISLELRLLMSPILSDNQRSLFTLAKTSLLVTGWKLVK